MNYKKLIESVEKEFKTKIDRKFFMLGFVLGREYQLDRDIMGLKRSFKKS